MWRVGGNLSLSCPGAPSGALPVYAVARGAGEERITAWLVKHGKWLLLRQSEVKRASNRFARHGSVAVFFSQLFPGVRGLIALPAGFAGMNAAIFALFNFAGSLLWCAVLAYAGHQLRAHYGVVHRYLGPLA